jgi:hypothetical protein
MPENTRGSTLPKIAAGLVLACVVLLLPMAARASSYSPNIPFPPACGTCRMDSNQTLTDGGWTLKMQSDGNLVMRNSTGVACFATNTQNHANAHVSYQSDGNFVVYSTGGSALWASNTSWIGPSYTVSIHAGNFYVGNTLIHGPC